MTKRALFAACISAMWLLWLCASLGIAAEAQLRFEVVNRQIVESRLRDYATDNGIRETKLKKMFSDAGCAKEISEQVVKHLRQPNLICVLPGQTDFTVIVGAHFDHVDAGDGVVDNWTGASLLPSLFQGLRTAPHRHTYVFVAFAGEEKGLLGSETYVHNMTEEQVAHTEAMINMDSLGLAPSEVWLTHADKQLALILFAVAKAMNAPLSAVNVDNVGSTDSESFAKRKIPRMTVHSVTQQTLRILHSSRDKLDAINLADYYQSYRLLAAYLAYLDTALPGSAPTAVHAK